MATPVGASFEIHSGRISGWREYFGMSPLLAGGPSCSFAGTKEWLAP
jgi:limonene-1,2-epoxide hydrolase